MQDDGTAGVRIVGLGYAWSRTDEKAGIHGPMRMLIAERVYAVLRGAGLKVGFIGLGNMGAHMARNLLKANVPVTVLDINPASVDALKKAGATSAATPKEIAAQANVIVTMLPSSPHIRDVYLGVNGLLAAVQPDSLLIDCSTVGPATARDVAAATVAKKALAADAPVSGGVGGAEAGTLTFMVGGPKATFDRAKPVLEKMGKNIVHCGDSGTGQVAKLCNNMLLAIGMIGTAEAMNLGKRLGMDPKLLANVINTSSGRNWSSDTYNPCPGVLPNVPASRNYTGGFATALMAKDLGLAAAAASDSKSTVPLGSLAYQIYTQMGAAGLDHKDFSAVFQWLNGDGVKQQ